MSGLDFGDCQRRGAVRFQAGLSACTARQSSRIPRRRETTPGNPLVDSWLSAVHSPRLDPSRLPLTTKRYICYIHLYE